MTAPAGTHWISSNGPDARHELMVPPAELEFAWVVVVALMTCGCRGIGHRVMLNPTGATASVSMWDRGKACLERRGVI